MGMIFVLILTQLRDLLNLFVTFVSSNEAFMLTNRSEDVTILLVLRTNLELGQPCKSILLFCLMLFNIFFFPNKLFFWIGGSLDELNITIAY